MFFQSLKTVSFFCAVNGVFGKLLNLASEVVILELVSPSACQYCCMDKDTVICALRIYTRWTHI